MHIFNDKKSTFQRDSVDTINITMNTLKQQLITSSPLKSLPSSELEDYDYRQFVQQIRIKLSKPVLAICVPILIGLNLLISRFFLIPVLQYAFIASLTAFVLNYTLIIRKYQLMPFIKDDYLDFRLKLLCISTVIAMLVSIYIGWNGSGGMLFAVFWQGTRGQKMGIYGLYFAAIVIGSLLMQENYQASKLIQFIPGLLLGWSNAEIYKLKESNQYTMTHQFLFITCIVLPVFFPSTSLVVPSLIQWGVMIAGGILMLFSVVTAVKMMQEVRVSVSVGLLAGILMIITTRYNLMREYVGAGLIIVGGIMLVRTEFEDKL